MRTSTLTGLRESSLGLRVLAAVAGTAVTGVITVILLANALAFWLDGGRVVANILLGAAIVLIAAAAVAWHRTLPAVRWLGVPVTLGVVALFWDLLIAFLPA